MKVNFFIASQPATVAQQWQMMKLTRNLKKYEEDSDYIFQLGKDEDDSQNISQLVHLILVLSYYYSPSSS